MYNTKYNMGNRDNCIFCKIADGKVPSLKIFENDFLCVFKDIAPQAPVHVVIISKKHINDVNSLMSEDKEIIADINLSFQEIAKICGLNSYRVVTNYGTDAGQSVFHLHYHLLGGRSFGWPPG